MYKQTPRPGVSQQIDTVVITAFTFYMDGGGIKDAHVCIGGIGDNIIWASEIRKTLQNM